MVDLNTQRWLNQGNNLVDTLYKLNLFNEEIDSKFEIYIIVCNILGQRLSNITPLKIVIFACSISIQSFLSTNLFNFY